MSERNEAPGWTFPGDVIEPPKQQMAATRFDDRSPSEIVNDLIAAATKRGDESAVADLRRLRNFIISRSA